jgi:hypothetical protein
MSWNIAQSMVSARSRHSLRTLSDRARYENKFRGIREPSLAGFAKCAEQQINALATRAIAQAKESGEVEIT